jgi:hypothetical protein
VVRLLLAPAAVPLVVKVASTLAEVVRVALRMDSLLAAEAATVAMARVEARVEASDHLHLLQEDQL